MKEIEAQVEKMKCCATCAHLEDDFDCDYARHNYDTAKYVCDKWEENITETQLKFLIEYLGEEWKGDIVDAICEQCGTVSSVNRTFTTPKDKQDLLEAVINKKEWYSITYSSPEVSGKFIGFREFAEGFCDTDFILWLILLSPIKTAELVCKWKGVE